MQYKKIIAVFNETGMSPEELAQWIGVSNSTYRRWLKLPGDDMVAHEYCQNIVAGMHKLLSAGHLSYDSVLTAELIEENIPDFFQAAAGQFSNNEDMFATDATHQDKITTVLSQLGNNLQTRQRVDRAKSKILKFQEWGEAWKARIQLLSAVTINKDMALVDRLVAYGGLFYLILPFDLVPDSIPVFGYIDDFGILGFAAAFYARRFPEAVAPVVDPILKKLTPSLES